jgi:predicted O-linked N-acetylglucosamine transferase (SPINDLY family)
MHRYFQLPITSHHRLYTYQYTTHTVTMLLLSLLVAVRAVLFAHGAAENFTDVVIEQLCHNGDVYAAFDAFASLPHDARALHSSSALQLILHADVDEAVALHKLAKAKDPTAIPPLAKRHLDKVECAGLGDLFYVSAVIIKELVDTNKAVPNTLRALKTLITLTSDLGLPHAAENAINLGLSLDPADSSLQFRSAVLTPGVYESVEHINTTRGLLAQRIDHVSDPFNGYQLVGLDEFTMSPTFYFVYQGFNDQVLLTKLQEAYVQAHPVLGANHVVENVQQRSYYYQQQHNTDALPNRDRTPSRKIRVGFVSSHFRRHSICKLFCGIMTNLDRELYEVYAFSSLQHNREDAVTQSLRQSHIHYVAIGMTFVKNRNEVTDRAIDILVRPLL